MANTRFAQPSPLAVVQGREIIARTNRANELQPGRVEKQGQELELNAFNLRQNQRTEGLQAETAKIKQRMAAGDPTAFRDFALTNPTELTKILAAQAKGRELDLKEYMTRAAAIGRFATGFTGSQKTNTAPEEVQRQYTQGRDALLKRFPDITKEDVPEKPNSLFLNRAMSSLAGLTELMKQSGFGQGQDIIETGTGKPGETVKRRVNVAGPEGTIGEPEVAAPKASSGGSGAGAGEIKSADTNALKAIINDRIGEFFDPTSGQIKVLDPDRKALALAVLTEASAIFARGGATHAAAVTEAAEKLDIQITTPTDDSVNRARPGSPSETRAKQLKAFGAFVDKLD